MVKNSTTSVVNIIRKGSKYMTVVMFDFPERGGEDKGKQKIITYVIRIEILFLWKCYENTA